MGNLTLLISQIITSFTVPMLYRNLCWKQFLNLTKSILLFLTNLYFSPDKINVCYTILNSVTMSQLYVKRSRNAIFPKTESTTHAFHIWGQCDGQTPAQWVNDGCSMDIICAQWVMSCHMDYLLNQNQSPKKSQANTV